MGRPPAYVFVVRHGNRLDIVDKQWHLTSPTPYDPPLTYGGWLQCKALGARIASILREREADDAEAHAEAEADAAVAPDQCAPSPKKRRRYRVVVHSSPFLRCVQTSVALSAGLGTKPSPLSSSIEVLPAPPARPVRVNQISSFSNPAPTPTRPKISTDVASIDVARQPARLDKSVLRLDPFLGEWQSPDYFEHITPPPNSSLMLMTAKAELLRKENYDEYPHFTIQPPKTPTTPSQLWNSPKLGGSPLSTHHEEEEEAQNILEELPDPAVKPNGHAGRRAHSLSVSQAAVAHGYKSPVPPYAVSASEPIPNGYVAHARDACVDVDYQWDSTRDEVAWGDGGALPEEWAAMHQRFRKGLKRLVDWYTATDNPGEMVTKVASKPKDAQSAGHTRHGEVAVEDENEDDMETENVVILVSHGAGCNALVGGITNQPVLADVPMASLTIARRKPEFDDRHDVVDDSAPSSLDDALSRRRLSVPDLYELKLFANTDHLQSRGPTPSVSRPTSRGGGAFSSALRDINFGAQYGQPSTINRSHSVNASLGSMRRSSGGPRIPMRSPSDNGGITVGSGMTSFSRPGRSGSTGLWQPKSNIQEEQEEELPMTLNFSHEKDASKQQDVPRPETPKSARATHSQTAAEQQQQQSKNQNHLPVRSPPGAAAKKEPASPQPSWASEEHDAFDGGATEGLWGSPRPPGEAERLRDFTSQKRRWTVTEQCNPHLAD